MSTLRQTGNPLSTALRGLMERWHGGDYGSMRRLADKVSEVNGGSDPYKWISRQLDGSKPKWQLCEWILDHCVPEDAEEGWREQQAERLAGIFYTVHQHRPPGYTGMLIVDGTTVEEAISSPDEASDPTTRVIMLQEELRRLQDSFERGEEISAQLRDQVSRLQDQLESLQKDYTVLQSAHELIRQTKQELDELVRTLQKRVRAAEDTAELIEQRLRTAHEEANRSQTALDEQKRAYEELEKRESQVRVALLDARDTADQRYRELDRYRQESDQAQQLLRDQIISMQRDMVELRERVQGLDSQSPYVPPLSSRPQAGTQTPHQEDRRARRGAAYDWMRADNVLPPDDDENLLT